MNIWKNIYLNCGERYEFMVDHRSYTHNLSSCEIKAWKKNSVLNRIQTYNDLCNTDAVLYRLSYQAILRVRNIPVQSEECKDHIWTAEKDMNLWLIIAVIHTTWVVVNFQALISQPEFFSGFNFTTAQVVCITVIFNHKFIQIVVFILNYSGTNCLIF